MEDSLISFTVYGEPVPWKRPRFNGKSKHVFEDSKVKEYKEKVIQAYKESGGEYFEKDVPIMVEVYFFLGVPKSLSHNKQLDLIADHRPTKRPDLDNIYKGITDALNKVAYYDDSQIISQSTAKFWSAIPRVEITIKEFK